MSALQSLMREIARRSRCRRCKDGTCEFCRDTLRWERIYAKNFKDDMVQHYAQRPRRHSSLDLACHR